MSRNSEKKLFGTDGIRGVANQFPLDDKTVATIGRALVLNLAGKLGRAPRIIIGRDTRESGPRIELSLARGAMAAGATVQSAGVITTPGIAYITRSAPFDAGVVISASHNPYQDNGIKVFAPSGRKLADDVERKIEADVAEAVDQKAFDPDTVEWMLDQSEREKAYQKSYMHYLTTDVGGGVDLAGLRIAIDCANGAAWQIAPALFARLGADVEVLGAQPDGRNINEACGSLHQEGLQRTVVEKGLDLGIAFDGDADRALFVDAGGNLVDGDVTLLILADHLKKRGKLAGDLVVATVMSNIGLEIALRKKGIELVRAQVGDRYVLEELLERRAKLGGEQSGHVIFPDISLAGDGMITAIELLRALLDSGASLGDLAAHMNRYPQLLVNIRVRSKPPIDTLPEVAAGIDSVERELDGRGRLLVRYSGTENLARVMIEGEDQDKIKDQANLIADAIRKAIGE